VSPPPRPRPPASAPDAAVEELIAALAALEPDDMSPREAIEALYALKARLAGAKRG
jgi:DNA mismatch repair protein MutS